MPLVSVETIAKSSTKEAKEDDKSTRHAVQPAVSQQKHHKLHLSQQ